MFQGVYGPASTVNRDQFWEELKGVRVRWVGPWVVGGGFNVIRYVHENNSGGRITRSMGEFEDLSEIATSGIALYRMQSTLTDGQDFPVLSRLD